MDTKALIESKTFWFACLQALVGVIVAFTTNFPDAGWVGSALVVKSVIDVILRTMTTTGVGGVFKR